MSMSIVEAIRVLGNLKLYHDDDNEIWEALNMAIEALKEQDKREKEKAFAEHLRDRGY